MSSEFDEFESLLLDWQDGTLDAQGVTRVREMLRTDAAARARFIELQMLDAALFSPSLSVPAPSAPESIAPADELNSDSTLNPVIRTARAESNPTASPSNLMEWAKLLPVLAAGLAAVITATVYWGSANWKSASSVGQSGIGAGSANTVVSVPNSRDAADEATSQGIALVTRLVDVKWADGADVAEVGDALRPGVVSIKAGLAQIEFFCGATVVVEGPAELELVASDAARFLTGRLRAQVPPAARGFSVDVGDTKIVDLGTEFGVSVSDEGTDVQVFDGEVELHSSESKKQLVSAGNAMQLVNGDFAETTLTPGRFVDIADLDSLVQQQTDSRYERWRTYSKQLSLDPRLIAYYAFDGADSWRRRLVSDVVPTNRELDGAIVGARQIEGRWPHKSALEFKQPGDRVRVSIPGEYGSLTLSTWVRIDSLDRWYNSLFLTDSYQQGEPHWQILDTGQLFFSVRVSAVDGGQEHREVLSPSFWNPTLSGKWLHLATTYNVAEKNVTHFLNGEVLSRESIPDEQLVETTRFGAASIGNWVAPTKPDEHFAIRNLNGRIDEFALFAAALDADEIREMFEKGKP